MDPRNEGQQPTSRFARSTSGAAQRHRILEALRRGPKTSFELRRLGIYQHSVRIFELREAGYRIETARVNIIDHDGYEHRGCARYSLVAEPTEVTPDGHPNSPVYGHLKLPHLN